MCYNATVSATTFLATVAVCLVLWWRNRAYDRPIALILFFISLMQAVEWGLWLNLDCGTVNKLLTAFIPVLLYAQPLVLNAVVGYYNAGWGYGYSILASIFAVSMLFKIGQVAMNYGDCATVVDGHLQWGRNKSGKDPFPMSERLFYMVGMTYPIVTFKHTLFALLYLLFSSLSNTLFVSLYSSTWPSVWCHFVNVLAVFALVT
jgi:hypothetical protein